MAARTCVFSNLSIWHDEKPRRGDENMAIDQVLLESCGSRPILRIYSWRHPSVSFGYFNSLAEAMKLFPSGLDEKLDYVRRWTGGGVVDHRIDITYTLAIPRVENLAVKRGARSYRVIHQALARVLQEMGNSVLLREQDRSDGGMDCFTNPVVYDLTNSQGRKIAGAGQRRSRYGLLHQGSVIPEMDIALFKQSLPNLLGNELASRCEYFQPSEEMLDRAVVLAETRYNTREWLEKRR